MRDADRAVGSVGFCDGLAGGQAVNLDLVPGEDGLDEVHRFPWCLAKRGLQSGLDPVAAAPLGPVEVWAACVRPGAPPALRVVALAVVQSNERREGGGVWLGLGPADECVHDFVVVNVLEHAQRGGPVIGVERGQQGVDRLDGDERARGQMRDDCSRVGLVLLGLLGQARCGGVRQNGPRSGGIAKAAKADKRLGADAKITALERLHERRGRHAVELARAVSECAEGELGDVRLFAEFEQIGRRRVTVELLESENRGHPSGERDA